MVDPKQQKGSSAVGPTNAKFRPSANHLESIFRWKWINNLPVANQNSTPKLDRESSRPFTGRQVLPASSAHRPAPPWGFGLRFPLEKTEHSSRNGVL